jgi:hypothetical protein
MLRKRPRTVRCQQCKMGIKVKDRGPVPRYCSNSCRQTAYLERRLTPMAMLAEDIATARVRALIRTELWSLLRELGLVPGSQPPPPPEPKPRKPNLHVVRD